MTTESISFLDNAIQTMEMAGLMNRLGDKIYLIVVLQRYSVVLVIQSICCTLW